MADTPIKRALVSVTDKTGVVDFVKALEDEFGMTFQDNAVGSIVTVGQVVAAIEAAK